MRNQNQKRSARKGFTLVEVIVVLVILALLAAIAIPAMTGWIDRAREKRLVVACRTCVMAAQTLVVETYGATNQATAPVEGDVKQLARVPGNVSNITLTDTSIATLTYTDPESSDFVTFTRLPTPKYEFGTGLTVSQAAAKIGSLDAPDEISTSVIYGAAAVGYANTKDGTKKAIKTYRSYAGFLNNLPADIKASLDGKTWTLTRTAEGALQYLYVCDDTYTVDEGKAGKVVNVSKYDAADGSLVEQGRAHLGTATFDTEQYAVIPNNVSFIKE